MTQIIGFAGRKQAGKNTVCNFIVATKIAELGIAKSSRLNSDGDIEITDIFGEHMSGREWFPFQLPYVDTVALYNNELGKFIKLYSFADKLKRLCIDVLGLKEELVFGTDKQKNTKTHIKWNSISNPNHYDGTDTQGYMTVREVLQFIGTDIFRGLDPSVWVGACLRQIEEDQTEIALISDVRFENEIKAIQQQKGFVIGLTRNPYDKTDQHESETQIDKCLEICDTVINNGNLSIPEQNKAIYFAIKHLDNITDIVGD